MHQFASIGDAQAKIEAGRIDYDQGRPHSSLGHLTPNEFLRQRQVTWAAEAGAFCSLDLFRYGANVRPRKVYFRTVYQALKLTDAFA